MEYMSNQCNNLAIEEQLEGQSVAVRSLAYSFRICDRICENPALPAIIDFALEAFIVTEVMGSFQQKQDYCMNGSTGP